LPTRWVLTFVILVLAVSGSLGAQQTVAPTTEPVGSARGTNVGNYNVTESFEAGYRFNSIGGDLGEYRTDVNYNKGPRLLGSSLSVHSREGHGHYFDEILLNTIGLGNDPYQAAILRIEKNGLYRYDMTWRYNAYYNPGLTVASGLHLEDTSARFQDHELTLLPHPRFQVRAGYSRNTENGPALTTSQEFDSNGYGYPVFANVRRQWNEYRLGAEAQVAGFRFTIRHRWDYFKDDTPLSSAGVVASGNPADLTVLQQFRASQPVHGSNPGWLGNLFTRRKRWGVNARMTYNNGTQNFALNEFAQGIGQSGLPAARQILVGGQAQRPDAAGDFLLSLFLTEHLSITTNGSASSNRIDGASSYSEVTNVLDLGTTVYFRYLGIRYLTNSTVINYRATNRIGFYGGFSYTDRSVRTIEGFDIPAFANSAQRDLYEVTNVERSVTLGARLRPMKPLTVNLDGGISRADQPLTPVAGRHYYTINGRAQYRLRRVQLSAAYHRVYNVNPDFSLYSSHSRDYNANASWSLKDWLSLDASYAKLHLSTDSFLAFFAGVSRPQLQTGFRSLYVSNIHAATLAVHFGLRKRTDVFVGYSITDDTGDGRSLPVPPGVTNPVQAVLTSVQTFPLLYESPLARVSVRITGKVRWNVGWQYYDYGQMFQVFGFYQNFHAHTGFTSLLWTF